jgi:hypothetical protein
MADTRTADNAASAVCALAPAGAAEAGRPLTTIVAAISGSTAATVGWVGDSRA